MANSYHQSGGGRNLPATVGPAGEAPAARGHDSLAKSQRQRLSSLRVGWQFPLHSRREMDLDPSGSSRADCWLSLPLKVRQRLAEHSGVQIEWWAAVDPASGDGRSKAVVIGTSGLCFAEPRVNIDHKPVYSISRYVLDPSSFHQRDVVDQPRAAPAKRWRSRTHDALTPQSTRAPECAVSGLSARDRGILGNLPALAQVLLQAPFLDGQRVNHCTWHYEGWQNRLDMFAMVLAGEQDVTIATGTRLIPVRHTEASAHWSLVCQHARVLKHPRT